jgi:general stress protein YciG
MRFARWRYKRRRALAATTQEKNMKAQGTYGIDALSNPSATPSASPKLKRGFAVMDPTQVRELARRGGLAAHATGKAHEFTPEEARVAGRKGGIAATERRVASTEATVAKALEPADPE